MFPAPSRGISYYVALSGKRKNHVQLIVADCRLPTAGLRHFPVVFGVSVLWHSYRCCAATAAAGNNF
jgi:hypothetical protein